MRSLKHWTPRYIYNRVVYAVYTRMHPEHPWLTAASIQFLDSWLRHSDIGFEWGCGRSTLWFSKRVAHLTSVEHNEDWFNRTKDALATNKIENVKPSLVTPTIARTIGDALPDTPISIGCETFDENHSRKIGRPSAAVKAIEAAKMVTKNNIHPQIYLIHSLPGESVQSLDITRNVIEEELDEIAEDLFEGYIEVESSGKFIPEIEIYTDRDEVEIISGFNSMGINYTIPGFSLLILIISSIGLVLCLSLLIKNRRI